MLGGDAESGFFSVKCLDSVLMLGGDTESGFFSVKFLDSVLLGGHIYRIWFLFCEILGFCSVRWWYTESGFFSVKCLESVLRLVGDTKSRFLSVKGFGFCSQVMVKWNLASSMMILGSVLRLGGDKEVRLFSWFLGFISEVSWGYRMFLVFSLWSFEILLSYWWLIQNLNSSL